MAAKPFASGHVLGAADVNDLTGVYDRPTAEIDVTNTTVETTIFTKSIAANAMSIDRMLRLGIYGDVLNSGAGRNLTYRCKFGATTWYQQSRGMTDDADRYPFALELMIRNLGAANSQFATGRLFEGSLTPATVGLSSIDGGAGRSHVLFSSNGLLTLDTTAAVTLAVTVQWDAASTSASFRRRHAILELL